MVDHFLLIAPGNFPNEIVVTSILNKTDFFFKLKGVLNKSIFCATAEHNSIISRRYGRFFKFSDAE
ncbi:hypothetical protein L9G74_20295, partial [Shewanella sp. C32]